MIMQSLICTYFLNLSLETFFQKFSRTFMDFSKSEIQVPYKDVKPGDRFSRIEDVDPYFGTIIYCDCLVTEIEEFNGEQYISFDYKSTFESYPGDEQEFIFRSGEQIIRIEFVEYFK